MSMSEKLRADVIKSEQFHLIEWLRSALEAGFEWLSVTWAIFAVLLVTIDFASRFSPLAGNALQMWRGLLLVVSVVALLGFLGMYLRRAKRELADKLSRMASAIDNGGAANADSATTRMVVADDGVAQVIDRAADVIGDRDEALRWLGTPVRALACATPVSLLATPEGRNQVLTVLDRLEHGVL
jgi:hypothetical protein